MAWHGSVYIACPPWQMSSPEKELDAPPLVQMALSNAAQSVRDAVDARYSTASGLHKLSGLGAFTVSNFTVVQDYYHNQFVRFTRLAPIKLLAEGDVVASFSLSPRNRLPPLAAVRTQCRARTG